MSLDPRDIAMVTGQLRIPQPRRKKRVKLTGVTAAGWAARKERIKEKNRRYWKKLQADPARKKDRREYLKAWRQANAERMRQYRATWREANPEQHRVYQRLWKRQKTAKLRAAAERGND